MAATGGAGAVGGGDEPNRLTCAVCLERFRRPKLLPCFHTFCLGCLQAVAGASPSFPCPACRATVLLPLGGVAALQTNYYIEQDLDLGATPTARLCDVCAEDREATHTCVQCQQRYCAPCRRVHDAISSCRSHTVVPLQPDSQGGAPLKGDSSSAKEREEPCPKHRTQAVILHCTACRSNICVQCKLTSHEGHATEDLADTGAKVKAKLRGMLGAMTERARRLQGVLSAMGDQRSRLQALRETSERGVAERAGQVRQWVDECRDKALESLRSVDAGLLDELSAREERVQRQAAAFSARSDHVTRVLRDGGDADVVALQSQLEDVSVDRAEVSRLLEDLASGDPEPYTCLHDPVAVRVAQLQEYIGLVKRAAPQNTSLASGSGPSTNTPAVLALASPGAAPAAPVAARKPVTVSEVDPSITSHKLWRRARRPKSGWGSSTSPADRAT